MISHFSNESERIAILMYQISVLIRRKIISNFIVSMKAWVHLMLSNCSLVESIWQFLTTEFGSSSSSSSAVLKSIEENQSVKEAAIDDRNTRLNEWNDTINIRW